ncbi:MAG: nucleotidyltransferase family protein [Acidothermaceae bacterium]
MTNGRLARRARRAADPLARLLLDSIDDSRRGAVPASAYPGLTAEALGAAVFIHKVAPAVYLHLREDADAPAELLEAMRDRYQQQILRQLQVQADIGQVSQVLGDAHLPWLTMKGPALAEHLWSRPDLRQYIDLDILVDRRAFGAVLDALVGSGAEMVDRNWSLIAEQVRGEVSLLLPNGTALDLHWNLVNNPVLRKSFRFSTPELIERSVDIKIGSVTVPTLDPADTLLHLAYHTAHSGGHRLMWLKDVERAAANPDLDWDVTLQRARRDGVALALAVVLARVGAVIGFEKAPPAAALGSAHRTAWGLFAAGVDSWSPAPMLPDDKFSGQIAFKNTRESSWASVTAAVASLRGRRGGSGAPAENPLYADAGGDAARAAYLRIVEGGREP